MDRFEALLQEKQARVLGAAFACFGKNGYQKTSVADIAAKAGISKASLFQYFGTKQALYQYLYRFAIKAITENLDVGSDDFFECIDLAAAIKLRVFARYPGMFEFLASAVTEAAPQVLHWIREQNAKGTDDGKAALFSKVDYGKFKPGTDRAMLFNAVTWINEGYIRAFLGKKDADTMRRELSEYLSLFKQALYQEEFLP